MSDFSELATGDEPFAELALPDSVASRRREEREAFIAESNANPAQAIGCYLNAILARVTVVREPRLRLVAISQDVPAPVSAAVPPSTRGMLGKSKHPRKALR